MEGRRCDKVFSHESGLHADGVIKHPGNYEGFDPSEVGLNRYLVVGKHSGRHGLLERLAQLNIRLDSADADVLLQKVRRLAQRRKRPLTDRDLAGLCAGFARVG